MTRGIRTGIATAAVLLFVVVAEERASEGRQGPQTPTPANAPAARPTPAVQPAVSRVQGPARSGGQGLAVSGVEGRALITQYCMGCHSDRVKSGGLGLSELNLDAVDQHAEIAEKA